MRNIGWLTDVFRKNSEIEWMYDLDLYEDSSNRVQYKRLAVQICINMIARTIIQSDFRVREDKKTVKNAAYYRLNVRPNKNQSASAFWQQVVDKLIWENECLIIQNDTDDLLVADAYTRVEVTNYPDVFRQVSVNGYTFRRTFEMKDVIFLQYSNSKITRLIDGIFTDYGDLIGRMFELQRNKGQIRGTVDVEQKSAQDKEGRQKLQNFINKIYASFRKSIFAIVPQQKGFTYSEHATGEGSPSAREINDLTGGFLDQVARALGIPPALVKGEVADTSVPVRNFMFFCVDPFLKLIEDELNGKLFTEKDFLKGRHIRIKRISYRDIFDIANAVDKHRSSGVMNGHELRDKIGLEESDDPIHDKFIMTKNYTADQDELEGGEDKDDV